MLDEISLHKVQHAQKMNEYTMDQLKGLREYTSLEIYISEWSKPRQDQSDQRAQGEIESLGR